jgi:hypothetical protein
MNGGQESDRTAGEGTITISQNKPKALQIRTKKSNVISQQK